MLPNVDDELDLVVAGFDAGMPYGDLWLLRNSTHPEPHLQCTAQRSIFAGLI